MAIQSLSDIQNGSGTSAFSTGGVNSGSATIDFGSFPGKSDTSIAVTGQSGIVSGSIISAFIKLTATSDHSVDEHLVENIKVFAGNIVAGTGFTIYGINKNSLANDGIVPMLYGQWSVGWNWG